MTYVKETKKDVAATTSIDNQSLNPNNNIPPNSNIKTPDPLILTLKHPNISTESIGMSGNLAVLGMQ